MNDPLSGGVLRGIWISVRQPSEGLAASASTVYTMEMIGHWIRGWQESVGPRTQGFLQALGLGSRLKSQQDS